MVINNPLNDLSKEIKKGNMLHFKNNFPQNCEIERKNENWIFKIYSSVYLEKYTLLTYNILFQIKDNEYVIDDIYFSSFGQWLSLTKEVNIDEKTQKIILEFIHNRFDLFFNKTLKKILDSTDNFFSKLDTASNFKNYHSFEMKKYRNAYFINFLAKCNFLENNNMKFSRGQLSKTHDDIFLVQFIFEIVLDSRLFNFILKDEIDIDSFKEYIYNLSKTRLKFLLSGQSSMFESFLNFKWERGS